MQSTQVSVAVVLARIPFHGSNVRVVFLNARHTALSHQARSILQRRCWSELQIPVQSLWNPLQRHGAWKGRMNGCEADQGEEQALFNQHGKRSPLVFQAGMFSIVPTIISVGSGVALMGAVSRASAVLLHLLHGLQSRSHPTNCTCINRELSSATWSFSTSSRRKTRIESGSLKDAGKRSNAARFYQYNTNTLALPGNC